VAVGAIPDPVHVNVRGRLTAPATLQIGLPWSVGPGLADGYHRPTHYVRRIILWTEGDWNYEFGIGHISNQLARPIGNYILNGNLVGIHYCASVPMDAHWSVMVSFARVKGAPSAGRSQVGCRIGRWDGRCGAWARCGRTHAQRISALIDENTIRAQAILILDGLHRDAVSGRDVAESVIRLHGVFHGLAGRPGCCSRLSVAVGGGSCVGVGSGTLIFWPITRFVQVLLRLFEEMISATVELYRLAIAPQLSPA